MCVTSYSKYLNFLSYHTHTDTHAESAPRNKKGESQKFLINVAKLI